MKFSKQTLLGTGVVLGGSVLLYATMHQVMNTDPPAQDDNNAAMVAPATQDDGGGNPLTADIQTEKSILAQKQKEREARVLQQEQAAQQYLTEQQRIEAEALARSRAENQLYTQQSTASTTAVTMVNDGADNAVQDTTAAQSVETAQATKQNTAVKRPAPATTQVTAPVVVETKKVPVAPVQPTKPVVTSVKTTPPAPVVAKVTPPTQKPAEVKPAEPVRPSSYQVKRGEGLIGLSRRYDVPLDVLASANNLSTNSALHVGQTINIPSAAQVQRIRQEAAIKEQQRQQEIARKKQEALQKQQEKQQYQAAQDKLREARQTAKQTDAKGSFGVQVALAADEAKAQEIAKKLQAAGYRVKTSQTTRGVRVVVGPETGKVAALALKDKINSDPRVPVDSGWVLYW